MILDQGHDDEECQREQERDRERRYNFTDEQREREQERNKERRQNFSDEHKGKSKKEKGKGDKISLKSKWRMNEREQEKIDAELATSGEERSEKQQSKKGVD